MNSLSEHTSFVPTRYLPPVCLLCLRVSVFFLFVFSFTVVLAAVRCGMCLCVRLCVLVCRASRSGRRDGLGLRCRSGVPAEDFGNAHAGVPHGTPVSDGWRWCFFVFVFLECVPGCKLVYSFVFVLLECVPGCQLVSREARRVGLDKVAGGELMYPKCMKHVDVVCVVSGTSLLLRARLDPHPSRCFGYLSSPPDVYPAGCPPNPCQIGLGRSSARVVVTIMRITELVSQGW